MMARRQARPQPEQERTLVGTRRECPACGRPMRIRYENRRTVVTLNGPVRLRLKIRRCESAACAHRHRTHRPEEEGAIALPQHEFGLDVIALVGALRHREHRSVPEIHRALRERDVVICERSVTNLLERYEELLAVSLSDDQRLRTVLAGQGRVLLALDGLQPDVGHEVLWVLRDCLSGEVLLARSLLSARAEDLALLLREVADKIGVPIEAVLSDGQRSIRQAVARALPSVPHQLCHFHYLREAALPIYEADRHAKKGLDTPAATLATLARARSRAHASSVAGNRAELWLGACACPGAGERRRADGRSGRAPLGRPHGGHGASPSLVLRGSVRLVAATVTRLRPVEPCDLAPSDRQSWCRLRGSLESRRYSRTLRTRFRRDPEAYLRDLEHQLGQPTLPV